MDKTDIPGTFSARGGSALGGNATGATLGPVNETNMTRIWNKHKQTNTPLKKKVFVAMSGGVDSSVAAALLKAAAKPEDFRKIFGRPIPVGFKGFDVVGIHMKCYNVDGCGEQDAEDAHRAAEQLDIPFYVFDFEEEYKRLVVDYMVRGYRQGITPNPDVMCNKEIKFGLFLKKALELGADYVATGHYVRLRRQVRSPKSEIRNKSENLNSKQNSLVASGYSLVVARDAQKDQSYFLWTLTQEQLRHCLFPIGEYTKPEVRKMAKKFGLHNAEKKDSQGICFLGKVALPDFLKSYIPARRGMIMTTDGRKVGEHEGAYFYTIGQRKGLHLSEANKRTGRHIRARGNSETQPWYVTEKDVKKNLLVVAQQSDSESLTRKEVALTNVNFIDSIRSKLKALRQRRPPVRRAGPPTGQAGISLGLKSSKLPVLVRIRYRQLLFPALLLRTNSHELGNKREYKSEKSNKERKLNEWRLIFKKPQKFIAPGQSAVFYKYKRRPSTGSGLIMLGGGIIVQTK